MDMFLFEVEDGSEQREAFYFYFLHVWTLRHVMMS